MRNLGGSTSSPHRNRKSISCLFYHIITELQI